MRISGLCYVQSLKAQHRRSGTLRRGRFKSCLVDSDRHLLMVCRCIELKPGSAAMVGRPEGHRWSGVHTHLETLRDPLITPLPQCLAPGPTIEAGACAYRQWLEGGASRSNWAATHPQ